MAASAGNHVSKLMYPRVFLFGDSLTQRAHTEDGCWGSLLAATLERKCDIVVRGFSGYNTRMCKHVLPRIFDAEDVASTVAFVLWLGANDCALPEDLGRQHVPLEEYVRNLVDMLKYLRVCRLPDEKVILMTPPPFDKKRWTEKCAATGKPAPHRDDAYASLYARAIVSLASQRNLKAIDVYGEMIRDQHWEDMLVDGLHLSKFGSRKVTSLLAPEVLKLASHLPVLLPPWTEVDREDPKKTLSHWKPQPS